MIIEGRDRGEKKWLPKFPKWWTGSRSTEPGAQFETSQLLETNRSRRLWLTEGVFDIGSLTIVGWWAMNKVEASRKPEPFSSPFRLVYTTGDGFLNQEVVVAQYVPKKPIETLFKVKGEYFGYVSDHSILVYQNNPDITKPDRWLEVDVLTLSQLERKDLSLENFRTLPPFGTAPMDLKTYGPTSVTHHVYEATNKQPVIFTTEHLENQVKEIVIKGGVFTEDSGGGRQAPSQDAFFFKQFTENGQRQIALQNPWSEEGKDFTNFDFSDMHLSPDGKNLTATVTPYVTTFRQYPVVVRWDLVSATVDKLATAKMYEIGLLSHYSFIVWTDQDDFLVLEAMPNWGGQTPQINIRRASLSEPDKLSELEKQQADLVIEGDPLAIINRPEDNELVIFSRDETYIQSVSVILVSYKNSHLEQKLVGLETSASEGTDSTVRSVIEKYSPSSVGDFQPAQVPDWVVGALLSVLITKESIRFGAHKLGYLFRKVKQAFLG